MSNLRIGIIGIGNMGSKHAQRFVKGMVQGAELKAVCDSNPERLKWAKTTIGDKVQVFENSEAFYAANTVDAVIIATPHYDHPPLAIKAFERGLHVLSEKPAGVYTKQVLEMNEAASKSGKVFGLMLNQRTNPLYQKLRDLVKSGELGEIKRSVWIITNWYRPQSYYNSGGWRATWAGEGGGVLINQDPHQLDLWQWICGMPVRVRAFCEFGKYHNIEVEDDVTAYVQYENGATGVFITSTADAPGTNRFELSGDRGKVVVEDGKITFWRLRESERKFNLEFQGGMGQPECWKCEVPVKGEYTEHLGIINNWVSAILKGTPLLAPGSEGIHSLRLSNAMYLSTWIENWVNLPFDDNQFYEMLKQRIDNSNFSKESNESRVIDIDGTY